MHANILTSTGVTQLGAQALTVTYQAPTRPMFVPGFIGVMVVLSIYNNNAAARTVSVAMTGHSTFSFDVAPGTSTTVLIDQVADLSITGSGNGVFAWAARS